MRIWIIWLLSLTATSLASQPLNPSEPDPAPLGGIALLAAAGAAYGALKSRIKEKE